MGDWGGFPRYQAARPLATAGGIAARSRRGPIGETWWSRRFIELLESFGVGGASSGAAPTPARAR